MRRLESHDDDGDDCPLEWPATGPPETIIDETVNIDAAKSNSPSFKNQKIGQHSHLGRDWSRTESHSTVESDPSWEKT